MSSANPRPTRRFALFAGLVAIVSGLLIPTWSTTAGAAGRSFHVEGGGWGHGVGMSQYGALGMANAGFSGEEIVTRYYTGTTVQTQAAPSGIRVYMGEFDGPTGLALTPTGPAAQVMTSDTGQQVVQPVEGRFAVTLINGLLRVWGPDSQIFSNATRVSVTLHPSTPVLVEALGMRFRYGQIDLIAAGPNTLRVVIGGLGMDQYLYGLSEVPSSWPDAALDAQALAARSYAAEKIQRSGLERASCTCSLLGSQGDQVYAGYEKEIGLGGSRWVAAVVRTSDRVVTYDGRPIQAFYSSSNGGYTEASEYGFVTALPYLQAFPDPYDAESPDSRWVRDYDQDQLSRWLARANDTNVGTVQRITIAQPLSPSGRVIRMVLAGTAGTKEISGARFRDVVNSGVFADGGGYGSSIKSLRFTISDDLAAYSSDFRGGVYVATGRFDGSGRDGIVTTPGPGMAPVVRVFDANGSLRREFNAYDPRFLGGATVAACDVDGDGLAEIVTAPGPSGGPWVRVWEADGTAIGGFLAYDIRFTGGLFVACGDVDGDGRGEVVTAPDQGGGAWVRTWRFDGTPLQGFMMFDLPYAAGLRIAVADPDGPGGAPALIAGGAGPGAEPLIRIASGDGTVRTQWHAYDPAFRGGVYVGAADVRPAPGDEILTGPGESGGPWAIVRRIDGSGLGDVFLADVGGDRGARVAGLADTDTLVVTSGLGGSPQMAILPV
ncbi:MAG: SpoIID/LytB domain-containing protein [Acidimicrobiia bacterium]|nr:SpoIID/LytB domain-containing protein [Acidimicrobiia bacterium]